MKYASLLILFLWVGYGWAQHQEIDWPQLSEVRYVQMVDIRTGYRIHRPRFDKSIKKLDGKEVEISGYILPLDVNGEAYVLSRYPYAACFFCGGGGLESVMDVWFQADQVSYRLDQYIELRGVLRTSDSGEGLLYLLDQAVEVN